MLDDLFHKCLDIAVFVPGLRDYASQICENPNIEEEKKFRLAHTHLSQRMTKWYNDEVDGRRDVFFRVDNLSKTNEDDELVQSVGYDIRFPNIRHCLAITLYWITALELFNIWETVYESTKDGKEGQAEYDVQLQNARTLSDNLCFSVRYCLRYDQGILGTHSASLPTWSVNRFCLKHGMEKRREWLYGVVAEVAAGNFNIPFLTKVFK